MRRRSLVRKLVILVAVAVGTGLLVSTGVALWQETTRYAQSRQHVLEATAQVFAAAAALSVSSHDRQETLQALRAIGRVPGLMYAEVRTADDGVLAALGSAPRLINDVEIKHGERPSLLHLLTSGTILVSVPVIDGGERIGEIVLISDTADLWPRLASSLALTLLGSFVALMLGLFVAWRFQQAITRPLQRLMEAMRRIQKDHRYDVMVEQASDREIGLLVDGFNAMLGDIRERDDRLAAYSKGLEQKVADRTRDLAAARDAAERANQAKSEFLATMSHEIRTPMNGIMVMAEVLSNADMPHRQRRFAEVIAKSGQSLLAIINDILDFSKIEAGKLELEQVQVNVDDLIENVTTLFAERARTQGVDLAAVVAPECPRLITGDPVRLSQVVGNLVNNALKFTKSGFVKLTVEPTDDQWIAFSVADTGIGIPPDKLATIFDAFSQADQSTTREFGGTGLGLAICRRIVHAMGGAIDVSSKPGAGSTFSVRVPAAGAVFRSWVRMPQQAGRPVCIVDVAGDATAAALVRYCEAFGCAVTRADGSIDDHDYAAAAIVWADMDRLPGLALGASDRRAPTVVALHHMGDDGADAVLASGEADVTLTRPVLRSEIEELLGRFAAGEKDLSVGNAGPAPSRSLPMFAGLKVLVADDSAVNLEVASEALARFGAEVTTVEGGEEAVRTAATLWPDLVLMDGSMPGMDGFTATRAIRAAERSSGRPRVPIVALTAHVVGAGAEEWRRSGMDAVIHKPFTMAQLAHCLVELVPHLQTSAADNVAGQNGTGRVRGEASQRHSGAALRQLLDADMLAQLTGLADAGRRDFVKRIFDLYVEHAPKACADLRRHAEKGDSEACARAAHALKSMSYNLGARQVATMAGNVEYKARGQGRAPSQDELDALADLLARTIDALAQFAAPQKVGGQDAEAAEPARSAAASHASRDDDLESDLLKAIARNELYAKYQPFVDRNGSRIIGVEALARWKRHGTQEVSPSVFVPIAERSGFINEIGEWMLRRACIDAAAWPDLTVAVNVSPIQFCQAGLADRVERILADTGMDPRRLELEITENALLVAEDAVLSAIDQLNNRGVTFALDDFGTGYSSLTYLRRFPFGKIKIDRSFVSSVHLTFDATIVHAVVSIGRGLGLEVVAEGTETVEQQRFLSAAGVHMMQGFLFAPPMGKDELLVRLAQERDRHPYRPVISA